MTPQDRGLYNKLLGYPADLPKKLVTLHERISKLHVRQGGGTLPPVLALMVVHLSVPNIETTLEKEKREALAAEAIAEEDRRMARAKAKREEKKREKVGV